MEKLENNIRELKETLQIKTQISSLEKQLAILNKKIIENENQNKIEPQENVKSTKMQIKPQINEVQVKQSKQQKKLQDPDNNYIEDEDEFANMNFLDLQMLEYELKMEKLEKNAKAKVSEKFEPTQLHFCKNLGFQSTKIYHNVVTKSRVDTILNLANINELKKLEHKALKQVLEKYKDLVYLEGDEWHGVTTSLGYHRIHTKTDEPINVRQYKLPYKLEKIIEDQVEEWLKLGIIEESTSSYNCPLYVVPRKHDDRTIDNRWRVVTDFRRLNDATIQEDFPMPTINELFDRIGKGNKYFTKLDLRNGFMQIPVDPRDRHKMAFSTHTGKYQFRTMSFGLKNAPYFFQRAMTKVLKPLINKGVTVYSDDILIYSKNLTEHMEILSQVLELLKQHNFKLHISKCEFLKRKINYLGHIITETGIEPDAAKIKAVKNFARPQNEKHIRMFLGLCGFYRRFIRKFAHISRCLSDLLKKGNPFIWTEEHENAFELLKQKLCEAPILTYPNLNEPFMLITDASNKCLGAVLAQGSKTKHNPISYWSRVLSELEQKYSTYEREALAIHDAIKHFRQYLYFNKFLVLCDHRPLINMNEAENNARVQRMRLKLQGYDFKIEHIAGRANTVADALSRLPTLICCIKLGKLKRKIKHKIVNSLKKRGRPKKLNKNKDDLIIENDVENCLENEP